MAEWLNSTFYNLDRSVFLAMHDLCLSAGGFFTPLFKGVTFLGNGGWAFLVLGAILLLFKKTRKIGLCVLLAIGCGALITNVTLKNLVARERPYIASDEYFNFWQLAKGAVESEKSFPSGHATVTMASMMAVFLTANKKWSWVGLIFALIMGVTRLYFIVHYFTDVFVGLLVGALAGVIGYFIMKALFSAFEKRKEKKAFNFILNADITDILKKK